MHHHFDGIIFPDPAADRQSEFSPPDRRSALKQIVAGGAAALVLSDAALADDRKTVAEPEDKADAKGYDRYVVVPRNFSQFRTERRKQLGVGGGYFRVAMKGKQRAAKTGFLAWLKKGDAKRIAAEKDVVEVFPIAAEHLNDPGPARGRSTVLMVSLMPNGWTLVKPPKGSYAATSELIDRWSKKFDTVKFKSMQSDGSVLIDLGAGGLPEKLLAALKKHPQVAGVTWNAVATTLALGEEGATTKALGEEGASTRRRGEEGGATTLRVGEEGGATTKALGEEGGGVTTDAVNEEGASTRALGEEGGRPPVRPPVRPRPPIRPAPRPGTPTTLALGEEG